MHHRRLKRLAFVVGLLGITAIGAPTAAWGATSGSVYSFELTTPNTAVAPAAAMMASSGDWIKVRGSGTFDTVQGTVVAGGSFVHYNADGTVHCKGAWKATALTSFVDFGQNQAGQEGGVLSMVVAHYCKTMGMTDTGIPMTVTSTVNAPAGSSYVEGTTVCDFTVPTGGTVAIEPEQ